jgi:hypothetical protein
MHYTLKFIFGRKLYMFRTVPLSTIGNFSLYTQQWYMTYTFVDILRAGSGWNIVPSCSQAVSKSVCHIALLCVLWKIPDGGQRNCPKHVEFPSKNKFERLVHLVWFIVRNLSRCTVAWTSNNDLYFLHGDQIKLGACLSVNSCYTFSNFRHNLW